MVIASLHSGVTKSDAPAHGNSDQTGTAGQDPSTLLTSGLGVDQFTCVYGIFLKLATGDSATRLITAIGRRIKLRCSIRRPMSYSGLEDASLCVVLAAFYDQITSLGVWIRQCPISSTLKGGHILIGTIFAQVHCMPCARRLMRFCLVGPVLHLDAGQYTRYFR